MSAFTDFLENKFIDWFFRAQAIGIAGATAAAGTGPANLYIGLLTAAPSDSAAGTEVSGNAYARVAVASSLANWAGTQSAGSTTASSGSSGTTSNNNAVSFPTPTPAGWGTVTHFGVYDSASGGSLLIQSALTASKVINAGDSVSFAAGTLTVQADN
jgi:hypothetical protein